MAISREEIEQIASEVATRVVAKAGLNCNCKDIEPIFLSGMEREIQRLAPETRSELYTKLDNVAKACGYERDKEGQWVQFPKQEAVLRRLGKFTILKEHDDGDLTLEISGPRLAVLTTEGELFTTTPETIRIQEGY